MSLQVAEAAKGRQGSPFRNGRLFQKGEDRISPHVGAVAGADLRL